MKKPQIRRIIPHFVKEPYSLSERIADFHIQVIERRLNQLDDLTKEDKLIIIDHIMVNIKSEEVKA